MEQAVTLKLSALLGHVVICSSHTSLLHLLRDNNKLIEAY